MATNRKHNKFVAEEPYILRIRDPELAQQIRSTLQNEGEAANKKLEIIFDDSNVAGVLRYDGTDYQLTVLNLPTIAECYKTYDDVNLVKTGDIGQVLIVGPCSQEECLTGEVRDGVTPPMRNARERVFRKPIDVPKEMVAQVESQILDILNGGAPQNYKFVDHEEVWQIDPATGKGFWAPAK